MTYKERVKIDVSGAVEKKNGLSYLSWAHALDLLLQLDEKAEWSYGEPREFPDSTMMVFCSVAAFGITRTAQLPVMDYKNKAIVAPNSFEVNVAMQRCLAKAIALHGIGLHIYKGEDIPSQNEVLTKDEPAPSPVTENAPEGHPEPPVSLGSEGEIEKAVTAQKFAGEADVVDFVTTFCNDFIPTIKDKNDLRSFWKNNKSVLNRVKAFSKPSYDAIEALFKQHAKELE
jgi:hypothetical protein